MVVHCCPQKENTYGFSVSVRYKIERIFHGIGSAARSAEPNDDEICLELHIKFTFDNVQNGYV